jgi:hypothetical protein
MTAIKTKAANSPQARLRGLITTEQAAAAAQGATADATRAQYVDRLNNFDPAKFLHEQTAAVLADEGEAFLGAEGDRMQSLNQRGIFGANLGGAQSKRDLNTRVARSIAQGAFQTAGLEQNRIQQFGSLYGSDAARAERSHERGIDLTIADTELGIAEENRRREEKRRKRAGRFGLAGAVLGGAGGFLIGGPTGAIAGAKAGASIGGAL